MPECLLSYSSDVWRSVGFIGYPNVGKSSVINTLRSKKVCSVAPIAGETKVWQYITLTKRIYLIDCPGVVYPSGNTEIDTVLKGVLRVENVKDPADYVPAVLEKVKPEYLANVYGLSNWNDATDFLTKMAMKYGKLLKGGDPDINTVAKMVLNDWLRGNLPYFNKPPIEFNEATATVSTMSTLSTEKLPAEELATDSSTELQEVPTRELNTDQGQVVGVNQDFGAIKVSAEFVKEDLCTPEEMADDGFNLESIDLTDVCDDDNIAVDANSSLQELITNSTSGESEITIK